VIGPINFVDPAKASSLLPACSEKRYLRMYPHAETTSRSTRRPQPQETAEWVEALDEIVDQVGPDRASYLLEHLMERAANLGVRVPLRWNTPTSIRFRLKTKCPIRATVRSNGASNAWRLDALAMVVRANKYDANIGGHLATYASLATLVEVGYKPLLPRLLSRSNNGEVAGDFVYFQGHASPECIPAPISKAA